MAAQLYRDGGFVADDWHHLGDDDPLPEAGAVILPLARFLESVGTAPASVRLAVLLRAADDPDLLAPHLERLELVAVDFAKFSDGRGYSTARLLRQRYGYAGELRAVGDVLLDQIPLMRRCGFTAFEIVHAPTRRALEAGHDVEVPLYLQPAERPGERPAGARAWARRPAPVGA
jgi:phosphoadenosine phosphosulfate reductase